MTDATADQASADQARRAFSHDGNDVGVVLCHGFTGAPGSMRAWADHLVAEGYSVRLPLLPGHGTRWQDANRTTFDDWLGAVTAAVQDLASTCRAVVVAGLSMGGTLALRLAELHPEVRIVGGIDDHPVDFGDDAIWQHWVEVTLAAFDPTGSGRRPDVVFSP